MKIFSQLLANEQTHPQSFLTCIYTPGLMVCDEQLLSGQAHLISRLLEELRNVLQIACVTTGLPWIWSPHSERKRLCMNLAHDLPDRLILFTVSMFQVKCVFVQTPP